MVWMMQFDFDEHRADFPEQALGPERVASAHQAFSNERARAHRIGKTYKRAFLRNVCVLGEGAPR